MNEKKRERERRRATKHILLEVLRLAGYRYRGSLRILMRWQLLRSRIEGNLRSSVVSNKKKQMRDTRLAGQKFFTGSHMASARWLAFRQLPSRQRKSEEVEKKKAKMTVRDKSVEYKYIPPPPPPRERSKSTMLSRSRDQIVEEGTNIFRVTPWTLRFGYDAFYSSKRHSSFDRVFFSEGFSPTFLCLESFEVCVTDLL